MRDIGHDETEILLKQMEKRIASEYMQAEKEIAAKLDDYLNKFKIKDELKQKALANGLITEDEYKQWRIGQIMMGKRWEEMRDTLAKDFTNADKIAKSIAYGYQPDVYAINHDYGTFQVEKASRMDTSYTLYDRNTVEELMKNEDFIPAPGRKISAMINENKDLAWNKKQVQSVMMQGIIQGESISHMATRLAETVGDSDRKAAIRNARTMTTGVENAGRMASYNRANDMGIKTQKQWLATLDFRTRHWHADLDGVTVDNDEPFKNEYGEIMYPGDPKADPANIYNCRCTMIASVKGFERDVSNTDLRHDDNLKGMSYNEWKEKHYTMESHSITKQDEIAETMKRKYNAEYKKYSKLDSNADNEPFNTDGVKDVTNEYLLKSTPGKGNIIKPDGFVAKGHEEEVMFADWLKDMLGGEIIHNLDSKIDGVHYADFLWNGKLWELKTLSTTNYATIDKRIQDAYHQIQTNKGGAFFDMSSSKLTINETAEIIRESQKRRCPDDKFDVLIRKDFRIVVIHVE